MAIMDTIKNISLGIILGMWDSIRGMTLLWHIDDEIHRINAEKEAIKEQRLLERQRRLQYSSSSNVSEVPSSAAAMLREERVNYAEDVLNENPDERKIESIRNKLKSANGEQKPRGEKKIAKQVLKCCLLNGGFTWLSVIIFEQVIMPTLKFLLILCYGRHSEDLNMIWGWLQSILSIIFGMMWVLPIFLLSKVVSSVWFDDIANAAYHVRKGEPRRIPDISKRVADMLFSLVVQVLFLMQSMLLNCLPIRYVGEILCFIHLCLLYSLYCFEYKWFNMGWELHRRLSYIENNWPYFLGFGIPLTVLTNMTSSVIVSSCIFSIFFPLFILSGNEAKPLVGTTETPLRLFTPVIFASNVFFNCFGGRSPRAIQAQQRQLQAQALQKQQQLLLKQRQQQRSSHHHQHHRREGRDSSSSHEPSPQRQQPTYRYQQPPTLLQPQFPSRTIHSVSHTSMRNVTPEHTHFSGGLRPLIPTPVSRTAPGMEIPGSEGPTVRHR